jgi:hypothetical protein
LRGRPLFGRRLRGDDGVSLCQLGLNGLPLRRGRFRNLMLQLEPFLAAMAPSMYDGVP